MEVEKKTIENKDKDAIVERASDKKVKTFEYEQQVRYLPCPIEELLTRIKSLKSFDCYAYILHDKDVNSDGSQVEPHYHIMVRLDYPITLKLIASTLGDAINRIEKIKTNFANALSYLTHDTETSKHKHQYGESEVISFNIDVKQEVLNQKSKRRLNKAKESLLDEIVEGILPKSKLKEWFEEHNIDKKYRIKWRREIDAAFEVYIEDISHETDIDMTVIYIRGGSGTGKSTYAKYLASLENKECYITSSNQDDLFSRYAQQPFVILDDPSANQPWSRMLNLLDNHTSRPIESRYHDKVLTSIDTMIITSTLPMDELFNYGTKFEQKQIRRRIPILLEFSKEEIDIYSYSESKDEYIYTKTIANPLSQIVSTKTSKTMEEKIAKAMTLFDASVSLTAQA